MNSRRLVIFGLCALLCACSQSAPPAPAGSIGIEEFKALAKSPYFDHHGTSPTAWEVVQVGGRVMVRPLDEAKEVVEMPPFLVPKLVHDADLVCHKVNDGWLVGYNAGEFGALLCWYSNDGTQGYMISPDQIWGYIESGGEIFGLAGMSHIVMFRGRFVGSLVKFSRQKETSKWTAEPFVVLHEVPEMAVRDKDGGMLVLTETSLVQVLLSGHMKLLANGLPTESKNSLVVDANDTAYIGMWQAVAEIGSLHGRAEQRVFIRNNIPEPRAATTQPRVRMLGLDIPGMGGVDKKGNSGPGTKPSGPAPLDTAAVEGLQKALWSTSRETRERAAEALSRLGPAAMGVLYELEEVLDDESPLVRRYIVEAVGHGGHNASRAVNFLLFALEDKDADVRIAAAKAPGEIGPDARIAIPFLVKATDTRDMRLNLKAAEALEKIRGARPGPTTRR